MKTLAHAIALASLAAGLAQADQENVDVRANIRGACRIESVQPVDFGGLQKGTAAADRTATGIVRYWCTKGLEYRVVLGSGTHHRGMQGEVTTDFLPYELVSQSPTTGTGRGPHLLETLVLEGTVRGADYNFLPAGGFRDTVEVTLTAEACCASHVTVDSIAQVRSR